MFNLTLISVQNEREKEKRSGGSRPGNQTKHTAQIHFGGKDPDRP